MRGKNNKRHMDHKKLKPKQIEFLTWVTESFEPDDMKKSHVIETVKMIKKIISLGYYTDTNSKFLNDMRIAWTELYKNHLFSLNPIQTKRLR